MYPRSASEEMPSELKEELRLALNAIYIVENDLDFILLAPLPECWDYRPITPCPGSSGAED